MFRSGPGRKATVGAAVHSDAAIAPALPRDPADHRAGVLAVALERNDSLAALAISVRIFSARVGDDARVTARGARARLIVRREDGELEQRRQLPGNIFRTDQTRMQIGSVSG